jgi:hypothetical protein
VKTLVNRLSFNSADRPLKVSLFVLALTAVALVGFINPAMVSNAESETYLPRQLRTTEDSESANDESAIRLSDSDVVIVVDSRQFFTPEGSRAIRHVVESLRALDVVDDVFWLDEAPVVNLFSLRNPIFPPGTASQRQFEQAREKALANPLIRGQLLSDDAETLLLMVNLNWLFVENDEQCVELLRQTAHESSADFPDVGMSFLLTGKIPAYLNFQRARSQNQLRYQIIGYAMNLLMAIVLFRGLRSVMIVSLAPMLGVFWTMGVLHLLHLDTNPFNDIVLPVLLSLVGLTDGVHLMVEIRRRRAAGESPRDASRNALGKVGTACFLTSLTTAIGLGALATAHSETVREFGWSCVIGVALTFFSVVLVIPLLCSTRLGNGLHVGHGKSLVDRSLGRLDGVIDTVLAHRKLISYIAVGGTLALVLISSTLRPDERIANALPEESEVARAMVHLDQQMHGMESGSVQISWSPDVAENSEEVLQVIEEVQQTLETEESIGHPVSLKSLIDVLPGDPEAEQRMSLIELLPTDLKRAFYVPEKQSATINFRVRDLGIAAYSSVFERIETQFAGIAAAHPGFQLALEGKAAWRWRNLHQIVVDLALSLGTASVVIFLVLTIAYRSIRLGLIALIPNFFPLALTGTWLVATGQSLEVSMVCAFTVCLGIAVDDTIHFLTRYREECAHRSEVEAIRSAFVSTGAALIMTTIILVIGFSTVIMSGMREQRIFATMACLTIGSALVGDLLFLPPMLAYFRKASSASEEQEEEETIPFPQHDAPDRDEEERRWAA